MISWVDIQLATLFDLSASVLAWTRAGGHGIEIGNSVPFVSWLEVIYGSLVGHGRIDGVVVGSCEGLNALLGSRPDDPVARWGVGMASGR